MKKMMIRYTVKPEYAAENKRLIEAVFAELALARPTGVNYASFLLPDGVSFMHVVSHENGDDPSPLLGLASFKAFQQGIGERVVSPPEQIMLEEVGSFGFWGV